MTLDEKCGTSIDTPFNEKYDAYLRHVGFSTVCCCLPKTKEELAEAYAGDEHFNSIPLKAWDRAAGYGLAEMQGRPMEQLCCGLASAVARSGVNEFAPSEMVCMLKHAARHLVLGTEP